MLRYWGGEGAVLSDNSSWEYSSRKVYFKKLKHTSVLHLVGLK